MGAQVSADKLQRRRSVSEDSEWNTDADTDMDMDTDANLDPYATPGVKARSGRREDAGDVNGGHTCGQGTPGSLDDSADYEDYEDASVPIPKLGLAGPPPLSLAMAHLCGSLIFNQTLLLL